MGGRQPRSLTTRRQPSRRWTKWSLEKSVRAIQKLNKNRLTNCKAFKPKRQTCVISFTKNNLDVPPPKLRHKLATQKSHLRLPPTTFNGNQNIGTKYWKIRLCSSPDVSVRLVWQNKRNLYNSVTGLHGAVGSIHANIVISTLNRERLWRWKRTHGFSNHADMPSHLLNCWWLLRLLAYWLGCCSPLFRLFARPQDESVVRTTFANFRWRR